MTWAISAPMKPAPTTPALKRYTFASLLRRCRQLPGLQRKRRLWRSDADEIQPGIGVLGIGSLVCLVEGPPQEVFTVVRVDGDYLTVVGRLQVVLELIVHPLSRGDKLLS